MDVGTSPGGRLVGGLCGRACAFLFAELQAGLVQGFVARVAARKQEHRRGQGVDAHGQDRVADVVEPQGMSELGVARQPQK